MRPARADFVVIAVLAKFFIVDKGEPLFAGSVGRLIIKKIFHVFDGLL
jgi:hypothetical protein